MTDPPRERDTCKCRNIALQPGAATFGYTDQRDCLIHGPFASSPPRQGDSFHEAWVNMIDESEYDAEGVLHIKQDSMDRFMEATEGRKTETVATPSPREPTISRADVEAKVQEIRNVLAGVCACEACAVKDPWRSRVQTAFNATVELQRFLANLPTLDAQPDGLRTKIEAEITDAMRRRDLTETELAADSFDNYIEGLQFAWKLLNAPPRCAKCNDTGWINVGLGFDADPSDVVACDCRDAPPDITKEWLDGLIDELIDELMASQSGRADSTLRAWKLLLNHLRDAILSSLATPETEGP